MNGYSFFLILKLLTIFIIKSYSILRNYHNIRESLNYLSIIKNMYSILLNYLKKSLENTFNFT